MKINVFDIELSDGTLVEPFVLDLDEDADINAVIAEELDNKYGEVPEFDWEYVDETDDLKQDLEDIRGVLRKYFEGYDEYDPNFSAQDAIDEISAIVGM